MYFVQLSNKVRESVNGGQILFFIGCCIQKCIFKKLMNITAQQSVKPSYCTDIIQYCIVPNYQHYVWRCRRHIVDYILPRYLQLFQQLHCISIFCLMTLLVILVHKLPQLTAHALSISPACWPLKTLTHDYHLKRILAVNLVMSWAIHESHLTYNNSYNHVLTFCAFTCKPAERICHYN